VAVAPETTVVTAVRMTAEVAEVHVHAMMETIVRLLGHETMIAVVALKKAAAEVETTAVTAARTIVEVRAHAMMETIAVHPLHPETTVVTAVQTTDARMIVVQTTEPVLTLQRVTYATSVVLNPAQMTAAQLLEMKTVVGLTTAVAPRLAVETIAVRTTDAPQLHLVLQTPIVILISKKQNHVVALGTLMRKMSHAVVVKTPMIHRRCLVTSLVLVRLSLLQPL